MARIRPYCDEDLESAVGLWHRAKRAAYPYLPLEQGRTLDDDRTFFRSAILARCRVWVCEEGDDPRAFLAMDGSYLDRLYVAPAHQRRGLGSSLLAEAFLLSPMGIELHTHQENHAARTFYERHGFRAFSFGVSPPPESAPDVEYRWRPGEDPPSGYAGTTLYP